MTGKTNNFRDVRPAAPVVELVDATDLKFEGSFPVTADPARDLQPTSRDAESAKQSLTLDERREKRRQRQQAYRDRNREAVREYDRKRKRIYRRNNKDKLRAYFADYYPEHREEMKANAIRWQKANPESARRHGAAYNKRHPHKTAARLAVANAIRRGRITRQPCEVCGNPRSQAHHDDYSKPLDVRWLCQTHHPAADAARKQRERELSKGSHASAIRAPFASPRDHARAAAALPASAVGRDGGGRC